MQHKTINVMTSTGNTFLIAEIGVNHNGDVDLAKRAVDAAVAAGADAVKFQIFKTEELVTPDTEKAGYQKETTGAEDSAQWSMLKSLELTREQHKEIYRYCVQVGVHYVCTPYDTESARFLAEDLGVAAIKVASSDATNVPFLRALDQMGRPVILSTGMCSMDEVEEAVDCLPSTRARKDLFLLQCTSEYPAPIEQSNLRVMSAMASEFGCPVGFSDHTLGNDAAAIAVAAGALIVEKHFTLDRSLPGPDHRASSEPHEFAELVRRVRYVESVLGSSEKHVTAAEQSNKQNMQKSIYWRRALKPGAVVTLDDLSFKRPAIGLRPSEFSQVVGRRVLSEVARDAAVGLSDLE